MSKNLTETVPQSEIGLKFSRFWMAKKAADFCSCSPLSEVVGISSIRCRLPIGHNSLCQHIKAKSST